MRLACSLLLLAAAACKSEPPPMSADAVFDSICARCHGAEGYGGPGFDGGPGPRNFHDAEFQASRTDDDLRNTIRKGRNGRMPAFGSAFNDEQLDGLVRRVRSYSEKEARR